MYRRALFSAAFCLLPILIFSQSNTTVYFEDDKFDLTYSTKQTLDSVANSILNNVEREEIALIGHTDTDASDGYNERLADRRARSVKAYLISKGVDGKFYLFSRGESNPVNENVSDHQKALNRRVEIIRDYNSENVVFASFEKPGQKFNINPQKPIVLRCQEGTSIHIGADAFDLIDPNSNVTIAVQEFYEKGIFIAANLTTKTKSGEILESRGMINIEAFQNGEPIDLKDGKSIDIGFRDREPNDGTTIFEGTETDNGVVWEEAAEPKEDREVTASESEQPSRETLESQGWRMVRVKKKKIYFWHKNVDGYWNVGFQRTRADGTIENYEGLESDAAMNNLLRSTNLGWINCDRFYQTPQPKVDFVVEYEGDFTPSVFLVFKEINSVMPYSYRKGNRLYFTGIPVDMQAEIVGLYKSADRDEVQFARKPIKVMGGVNEEIDFLPVELETVEGLMATL
ncbi:OmpA family protein [Halocola ammonii]